MALIKPIAQRKNAFDSSNDELFSFVVSGGSQVVKNRLTIRLNSDNSVVYQNTQETYQFNQTVPSGTLENGNYYNYYFNTYDINDNISDDGTAVSFYCYTNPTLEFTNIEEGQTINNGTYEFDLTYEQDEEELLDFVKIDLYSISNELMQSSGNLYSSQTPPIDFSYTFSGLEDNTNYIIKANGVTVNGTVISSDSINFNILYINPTLYSNLLLENKCDEGYVQISSNIIVLDGESCPTPPIYIRGINEENTWSEEKMIDVRFPQHWVKWSEGFEIPKDFEISIWGYPTWIYKFLKMTNGNLLNKFECNFVREIPYGETTVKDYFELSGYKNGILNIYQRSNYVDVMTTNDYIMIFIKKVGNEYTLNISIITKGSSSSIDWGVGNSNVNYNTLTDLNWENENYPQGIEPSLLANNIDDIFPLTSFELFGNLYDNLDITKDTTKQMSTTFPIWDYNTILNCDFNGNIMGGNVDIILSQLSGIKIKRRELGTYDWITIYEKEVFSSEDLNISTQDSFVPSGINFQWALVPILNGGIEGDYIVKDLKTILNGTFLSNKNNMFKLYNSVVMSNGVQNIRIGQLQPIGKRTPILIQNGKVNNYSGTISADLYGYNFEDNRIIDRNNIVKQSNDLLEFLTSGKAFCLTDWNGNIYIARTSSSPNINYNSGYGNGIVNISFNFVEQGKYNNQEDMVENGLIDIEN